MILSIYAPTNGESMYNKQILHNFKNQIDQNTIIVGTLTHHSHCLQTKTEQRNLELYNTINDID